MNAVHELPDRTPALHKLLSLGMLNHSEIVSRMGGSLAAINDAIQIALLTGDVQTVLVNRERHYRLNTNVMPMLPRHTGIAGLQDALSHMHLLRCEIDTANSEACRRARRRAQGEVSDGFGRLAQAWAQRGTTAGAGQGRRRAAGATAGAEGAMT